MLHGDSWLVGGDSHGDSWLELMFMLVNVDVGWWFMVMVLW